MHHNDRLTSFYLNRHIFIFLVFLPSIPIITIGGFYQPLRLDFLLMVLHSLIFIIEFLERKQISKFLFLFLVVSIFFIFNSSNIVVGVIQSLAYISFFASFKVGFYVYRDGWSDRRFASLLHFFIYFTLIAHVLGVLGLSIGLNLGAGYYKLLGLYGTFGMPFKFGLFLIILTFLMLQKIIKIQIPILLLIAIGILSSDSRISLVCLTLVLFFANSRGFFAFLFLVPIGLVAASPKMAAIFSASQTFWEDASAVMRIVNFQNYMEWLTGYNFAFGQGALAFLEFGIAYGQPGPLDMLAIRLFSEFGVLLVVVAFVIFVRFIYKIFAIKYFIAFLMFFVVYSVFNEGIFSLRAGNFFWFALGIFYNKSLQLKNNYPAS